MPLTEFATHWITPAKLEASLTRVSLSKGATLPLGNRDASLLLEATLMMQAGSPITPLKGVKEGLMDASLVSNTLAQGKVLKLGFVSAPYLTYIQMHVSPQAGDAVLVIDSGTAMGDDLLIPLAFLESGTMIFAVIQNYLIKRPNSTRLHFLVATASEEESRAVAGSLHLAFNHMSHILSSLMMLLKPGPSLLPSSHMLSPIAGKAYVLN